MFRASSAHLQEDTVVHMQPMVLSLSVRVPGGLSVHSLSSATCWKVTGFRFCPDVSYPDGGHLVLCFSFSNQKSG